MATAEHRSDFIAVSLRERISGRLQTHKAMTLKTRKLQIRLTEEELTYIKEHSINYSSMSHFIRRAIKEYSDPVEVRQLQLIKTLGKLYRDNRDNLSQVSNDLDNAVKRANELALSDHLTQTYFSSTLVPELIRTREFIAKKLGWTSHPDSFPIT